MEHTAEMCRRKLSRIWSLLPRRLEARLHPFHNFFTATSYLTVVNHIGRHIVLLIAMWLMIGSSALAEQPQSFSDDEFCSARPPSEIRCPKTQAITCLCFMSGKSTQAEVQLQQVVQTVTVVKFVRPSRSYQLLPKFEEAFVLKTFIAGVPTQPPRQV